MAIVETANICDHTFIPGLLNSDSIILDVGANRGEFCAAMINRFHCRIVSAEPVKSLHDRVPPSPLLKLFKRRCRRKEPDDRRQADEGRCPSVLPTRSTDSEADVKSESVEMVTLAELRRRGNAEQVTLMKMDIEGAEIDVFNSCTDAELQCIMQITIEFHEFLYPEQKEAVGAIRKRLRSLGFWDIPFSLDSTNVLFVNRKTGLNAAQVAYLMTVVRLGEGLPRRVKRIASKFSR